MSLLDETRAARLVLLARERFDARLEDAELRVLRDSASSFQLPYPTDDAPWPEVRGSFLRWLATDADARKEIDPRGLRVHCATVTGVLDLGECRGMPTLDIRRCNFPERIILTSAGTNGLYLYECEVPEGILGDRMVVAGPIFFRGCRFGAEVRLLNAEIKGIVSCNGTRFTGEGNAISLGGASIGGGVFLVMGFESSGAIQMAGTAIKGALDCSGAKLSWPDVALLLDGATIGGAVFLNQGFQCAGDIQMIGAAIKGNLECHGGSLADTGDALTLDGAKIGGSVYLDQGLECAGTIRLPYAEIGGDLNFLGASVGMVGARNLQLRGDLIWMAVERSPETYFELTGARIRNLRDDRESWPVDPDHAEAGMLDLNGLVYDDLTLHKQPSEELVALNLYTDTLDLKADDRIAWLKLQRQEVQLQPQPWMQLANYLERKGDQPGAKHVMYEYRCLQAAKSRFVWRRMLIAFAWLEENPVRILWPIALTLMLGTAIFAGASCSGAMVPTSADRFSSEGAAKAAMLHYPPFNPFIYTLENSVPLVKLGMDDKWAPDSVENQAPDCDRWCWFCRPLRAVPAFKSYWFLASARWLLIFAGWFEAAVLGAAITSRFKA